MTTNVTRSRQLTQRV